MTRLVAGCCLFAPQNVSGTNTGQQRVAGGGKEAKRMDEREALNRFTLPSGCARMQLASSNLCSPTLRRVFCRYFNRLWRAFCRYFNNS